MRESEKAISGIDGIAPAVFFEHVRLLDEAGLVTAALQIVQNRTTAAIVWRLTWAGQDFADAITSDTLWQKAKDNVLKPTGSWTFDVLKEWLKTEISQGLPTLRGLGQ